MIYDIIFEIKDSKNTFLNLKIIRNIEFTMKNLHDLKCIGNKLMNSFQIYKLKKNIIRKAKDLL